MQVYRVWATNRSAGCLLLADSEADAIETVAELGVYGDHSLSAARDSDNWELPEAYVVLPNGSTMPKKDRA